MDAEVYIQNTRIHFWGFPFVPTNGEAWIVSKNGKYMEPPGTICLLGIVRTQNKPWYIGKHE